MRVFALLGGMAFGLALSAQTTPSTPPGYAYGNPGLKRSPLTIEDLRKIEEVLLFTDEDRKYLRMSREVLADQTDAILDVWYGFVASKPQLLASFSSAVGKPDAAYLAAVRQRFGRWILDTADAKDDQAWLDWQLEIGRRHHRIGKNKTDHAKAAPIVPFRYLHPLVVPVTATLKAFLAKKGHSPEDVERMHQAWIKSVLLQVTLWSEPYVRSEDF